ncbi:uncharacterized protein LOC107323578 [Coturnix japonica]|uniref:uncharacterized protein LOC107323578 n=1 Tax=Coturnix japonica TaxID=93934 RepID=UPI000777CB76|nr:uncharacterized protein LOC107323578 [Coturnix japonica]XP_015738324.1 uncharacterized protein LOC107323578 [Coturnix japonica]XP_015738325.1 uncharacterized protein LOC107323578 [Coturnix japonica]
MKFPILFGLLGVLLAPALAEENHGRASGERPHLPPHEEGPRLPPHEEGPRHPPLGESPHISIHAENPPHFEVPHPPLRDESPRHPPAGEHPHYLFLTRVHHENRPRHPRYRLVGTHGFAIRPPVHTGNWKTVWDARTGFMATKVLGKNTCIISKAGTGFNGFEGASSSGFLPPIEHRYVISNDRLLNLYPYGPRIQRLCKGVPTYFAYPSPGSNFSEDDASCITNMFNNMKFIYCNL